MLKMVTLPYREKVGEDVGGRDHKAGGLNRAEGMTEKRDFGAEVIKLLDLAKRDGKIESLRRAEKIAQGQVCPNAECKFCDGRKLVVEAIRAEREKVQKESV